MQFALIDYLVFGAYCLLIVTLGLWVSREKKGHVKNAEDYFLASKSLPWWAIGASLIASNISAEQFIGMSGSGFRLGLAIATYEWMAAITLLLVAWLFIPIYLKKGIYTMPQFLEVRYDARVRTLLAVFWLLVYVFVNLTSVVYLGALALRDIMGIALWQGVLALAVFATVYSIYGGLKAVAWTDVVQVCFLIGGGLLTTVLALNAYSGGEGAFSGLSRLLNEVPDRFNMILNQGELIYTDDDGIRQDAWELLPRNWCIGRRYVDSKPVLLGVQSVHHPTDAGCTELERSAAWRCFCRFFKAASASDCGGSRDRCICT